MNKFFIVERTTRAFISQASLTAKNLYTLKDCEGYLTASIDELIHSDTYDSLLPMLQTLRQKYTFCEFSILQFQVEQTLKLTRI